VIAVQITSLSLSVVGLAFLAGVVSFVSPCVLPLLPAYLSIVSGVGVDELGVQRRRVLTAALRFVAGFTLVFVVMGASAGGVVLVVVGVALMFGVFERVNAWLPIFNPGGL